MDSTELYHIKQQFTLGAYKFLADSPLPSPSSPAYHPTLLYKARALVAIGHTQGALALLSDDSENVAVKAIAALAKYVGASLPEEKEAGLEQLRDLCVEIEGDGEDDEKDKELVRVIAGTAFARAGEVEEALESLGAGTDHENLEAVAVIVHIYLSINRPDPAKKEFDRSKRWAEDDLLLQVIESSIGLVTGKDAYANASSFYTEQISNPSLSSPHLLTARGVTRLLRNEIPEAKSDLEEAQSQQTGDAETFAALVVATGLGATKIPEAEDLWTKFIDEHPSHPLVTDVAQKAGLFDEAAQNFEVPPLAVAAA
jgi:coatomer protein complex subunit epsilon